MLCCVTVISHGPLLCSSPRMLGAGRRFKGRIGTKLGISDYIPIRPLALPQHLLPHLLLGVGKDYAKVSLSLATFFESKATASGADSADVVHGKICPRPVQFEERGKEKGEEE